MNVFAIVYPHRRGVAAEVQTRALEALAPFDMEGQDLAIHRYGEIVGVWWAVHPEAFGMGEYALSDENAWLTFNGYPLVRDAQHTTVARALLSAYGRGSLPADLEGGFYAVAATNGREVEAYTGLSNTEPIYYARSAQATVIGNRASLTQRLAHERNGFTYNLDALISMCTTGWPVHLEIPFTGVSLLPPGLHLRIGPDGETRRTYRSLPFGSGAHASVDEAAGVVAERLEAAVAGLGRLSDGELQVNLSGGKDSRLVAAAARAAGLRVSCITSGAESDREVVVAREVSDYLDLPHTWTPMQERGRERTPDLHNLLKRQVLQGEGMTSIYDPCYQMRRPEAPVRLVGHGGGAFKGGYDSLKDGRRPPITQQSEAASFLGRLALPNQRLLTPEAVGRQLDLNRHFVEHYFGSGAALNDFYDHTYLRLRESRANGAARQASGYGAMLFSPFLDDRALEAVLSTSADARAEQVLYAKVMDRFDPGLARMRFSDSRWRFEQDGPVDWFDPRGWHARAPLPPGELKRGQKGWRHLFDGPLREPVTEILLGSPGSPIFELIDRDKLAAVLQSTEPTTMPMLRTIYGSATVQYLLTDAWHDTPPSNPSGGLLRRLSRRLRGRSARAVIGANNAS